MQNVMVGYVRGDQVDGAFLDSLTGLVSQDGFRRILGFVAVETGPLLAPARNHLARIFLATEGAEWLFMVDTDMVFGTDVIERLEKVASPHIVAGGLCFAWYSESRVAKPTLYGEGIEQIVEWTPGELVPVYATGAACLLIHRRIFETTPYPWFTQAEDGSYGEDQGFCRNVQAAGHKIVVDTGTPVLHSKRVLIGPGDYDRDALLRLINERSLSDQSDQEVH